MFVAEPSQTDDGLRDAEFIAAARTAVPKLLDALDKAEAEVQRLREGIKALADEWGANHARWVNVSDGPRVAIFGAHANRLRALLDGAR